MRALILGILVVTAGCLKKTEYKCAVDGDCTAGGAICEPSGYCSFVDDECSSGHRYGELSGPLANQCVAGVLPDGGVEDAAPDVDAAVTPDGPTVNCPATYTTMIGTHYYRVITTAAIWSTQRAACAADAANTYLAIPGDQAELTAIRTTGAAAQVWVGIDDQAAEGTYATVRGGTLAMNSPLWDTGEPNDDQLGATTGVGDCVVAVDTNGNQLADDRCDRTYVAVCECEP